MSKSSTKGVEKKVNKKNNSVKVGNAEKKVSKKSVKKIGTRDKVKEFIKNKKNIINFVLILFDLGLIIYVARDNIANYVNISGKDIFVGDTKNLFLGRNYITLVITLFMYIYWLVIDKFLFKTKTSIKRYLVVLCILLLFNVMMFYLFTNRVY